MLCQSTYKEVSANGLVSVSERVAMRMLTFFIYKGCHDKVEPGYSLTFCITKPVDNQVKIIIFTESALR